MQRDFEKYFFGDAEPVEFGADQCKCTIFLFFTNSLMGLYPGILVRDDTARKRLKERLGENSIIM